ncbi:MAG: Ger(x)C family spore germination protein [Oscillospiraceae bacterium]|nr:Ger(x)C family spore germination protein [Oscillospiraceae bacterium]
MKKLIVAGVCLVLSLLCCGCFPTTQLEERAIVQAAAVDHTESGYAVTLQVFAPLESGENSGGSNAYLLLEGSGQTLTQAFEAAAQKGKEIYLGSCHTLVVGGNALRQLKGILDYFNSRPQTRATMQVACTGGEAAALLKNSEVTPSPAADIEQLLLLAQKEKRLPHSRLMDILSALEDPTCHAVLPLLNSAEEQAAPPLLSGGLFYRDGTVDLTLSAEELVPLNWLEKGRGNLLLELEDDSAVVLLEAFKPQIAVSLEGSKPQISLKLRAKGRVSEYEGGSPDHLEQAELERLQQAAAQQMADQLNTLMQRLCQSGCDPLRLGDRLKRSHPDQWATAAQSWPQLLWQAQWKAQVDCRLTTYSGK